MESSEDQNGRWIFNVVLWVFVPRCRREIERSRIIL